MLNKLIWLYVLFWSHFSLTVNSNSLPFFYVNIIVKIWKISSTQIISVLPLLSSSHFEWKKEEFYIRCASFLFNDVNSLCLIVEAVSLRLTVNARKITTNPFYLRIMHIGNFQMDFNKRQFLKFTEHKINRQMKCGQRIYTMAKSWIRRKMRNSLVINLIFVSMFSFFPLRIFNLAKPNTYYTR